MSAERMPPGRRPPQPEGENHGGANWLIPRLLIPRMYKLVIGGENAKLVFAYQIINTRQAG